VCHIQISEKVPMKDPLPPIPPDGAVLIGADAQTASPGARSLATRDPKVIRPWAERHHAEPALDNGRGPTAAAAVEAVRFNFPGLNRHRPVPWEEWIGVFQQHHLVFIYEEDVADRAYELWQSRQAENGQARQDWFTAERDLQSEGVRPSGGYRFVQA
jgi:hypothetical protein